MSEILTGGPAPLGEALVQVEASVAGLTSGGGSGAGRVLDGAASPAAGGTAGLDGVPCGAPGLAEASCQDASSSAGGDEASDVELPVDEEFPSDEERPLDEDLSSDEELPADEEQGMFEHFRLNVDKGQTPLRVDKYMSTHLEHSSRHRVQLAIKSGYVLVNDKAVKANYIVKPLDVIRFVMPYERRGVEILPEDIPLDIVYEDDDLLVVNKPAGMVVHPGHGHFSGTLVNALAFHLGISQGPDGGDERMGVLVHRIDKDTSGLLVVAKNDEAQLDLAQQFFRHSIERKYIAVVWGNIEVDSGTVETYIGRDPSDRLRFKVVDGSDEGKHAVTHYRVVERLGFVTIVECVLETGRTHQIRVHLTSIGHPLFNDERYGGSEIRKGTIYTKYRQFIQNCFALCPRQALHAATLGFVHPRTRKEIRFEAPLPADMQALIAKWRSYASHTRPEE